MHMQGNIYMQEQIFANGRKIFASREKYLQMLEIDLAWGDLEMDRKTNKMEKSLLQRESCIQIRLNEINLIKPRNNQNQVLFREIMTGCRL